MLRDLGTVYPTKKQADAWITQLKRSGKSWSHCTSSASALEWLFRSYGPSYRSVRPKKPARKLREYLSEEDINQLLAACRSKRDKCLVALLAYSGLRCNEACHVRVEDVNFKSRSIFCAVGKGGRQRHISVHSICLTYIQDYIVTSGKQSADYLFSTCTGSMRRSLGRIAKRVGTYKRVTPQALRRSIATNLHVNGCDIITIQQLLG